MIRFIIASFLLFFIVSCNDAAKEATVSENNIDAARNFIRAALDGKFHAAKKFMLEDSVNLNYLEVVERAYARFDGETKNNYRGASINIHTIEEPLKDSVTLLVFSNSFKNDHDTLKVLKMNGQWLVDLKFLYEHDSDTTLNYLIKKDSLP